ncbi:cation channel sperm-associated protein 3-like [Colossoma macropomum]|uniref:cation channel sperm-associated protein 3-like n=1 Tax=Colossoma macropomum TaxID=42526 RepID=UPI001864E12B|nr:cation channel sperm-associated protein 3-like [Colossoma macropomum]
MFKYEHMRRFCFYNCFRLFRAILQALVVMLAKAMKRAVYVMSLVFFIMFIFAVAGVLYFGEQASGDLEHWGDLGSALLTIFGLVTLDGWVDLLKKVDSSGVTYSRLFPVVFILIGHFIFFNMFVGLVIMEVERMTKAREEGSLQEREAARKRKKEKKTMKQLIGSQVSKLKKWSDTNVKTDKNFPQIIQQLRMSLSDSDHVVTKDRSSSLTFIQIYLTTLRHQDATLDKLQQIYDEMLEVLSELLELQQEEQREEEEHERDTQ